MANIFGLWTVIADAAPTARTDGRRILHVQARCACGTLRSVQWSNLSSGKSKRCGCFRVKRTTESKTVHGDARKGATTVEYSCWQAMLKRCNNEKTEGYENYGGRGIKVCDRWQSYGNFLADMGRRPSPSHSLERKDNDGHYEPSNCKWATAKEQRLNQRRRARIEQFSDTEILAELARRGYQYALRVPQHHGTSVS